MSCHGVTHMSKGTYMSTESVLSAFIGYSCNTSETSQQNDSLIDKSPFTSVLLRCHNCITWRAKVHLLRHPSPLISIFVWWLRQTLTAGRIILFISFCAYHVYALSPYLVSCSGVCGTLGGERRLLQPRFVVWLLCLSSAWSDDRFNACWRTACFYLLFNGSFFFTYLLMVVLYSSFW